MPPKGGAVESAAISRAAKERATSTPVRHQTRTAPLIRGRGDFRCASIGRPPTRRVDYNAVALNQSWGSYLVVRAGRLSAGSAQGRPRSSGGGRRVGGGGGFCGGR